MSEKSQEQLQAEREHAKTVQLNKTDDVLRSATDKIALPLNKMGRLNDGVNQLVASVKSLGHNLSTAAEVSYLQARAKDFLNNHISGFDGDKKENKKS